MPNIFYINGQYLPENEANINITDLGLLRGYGVFDFFRVIDGQIVFLNDHLARFKASAAALQLAIPYTEVQLKQILATIISYNTCPLLGIKLVLTGGYSTDGFSPSTPNFFVIAKPFAFAQMPNGMALMSLKYQRELAHIKSLNYMQPIQHLAAMKAQAAHDYLYHSRGYVTELSRSNLFLVKNNQLITPKNGILAGVTRHHVITMAKTQLKVVERAVHLHEVFEADELFTTGSTKRIIAIGKIDGQNVGKTNTLTLELASKFIAYEKTYGY
jgi:branched-chain amino acid aminotransferase